ncbi:MAG: hypothetical protein P0Y56_13520 [Candidatus Andeanibacterium colombiense]|uniref:Uncharacterized protein n=1 Tax=Candidatus Andeanibacterium colombiense TaxID=3121345 RepID=A0AAJ5X402_9SPHN|nr:MAG: hypothetical protein P0Y56_13520 [Sphingomonadaceae bacterium]
MLLDIWKDLYVSGFEAAYPKLSEEGLIASDNMTQPEGTRPTPVRFTELRHARRLPNGLDKRTMVSGPHPNAGAGALPSLPLEADVP